MKTHMDLNDITQVSNEYIDAKIKKNPESVELIASTDLIPDEYINKKIERIPDKKAIKEALKSGNEITFARLVGTTRLDIK